MLPESMADPLRVCGQVLGLAHQRERKQRIAPPTGRQLGLACPVGSFEDGHVLIPQTSDGGSETFACVEPSCVERASPADCERRLAAVQTSFEELRQFYRPGSAGIVAGCAACRSAELAARSILAPQHHAWMSWISMAVGLASGAADTRLLLCAYAKRAAAFGDPMDDEPTPERLFGDPHEILDRHTLSPAWLLMHGVQQRQSDDEVSEAVEPMASDTAPPGSSSSMRLGTIDVYMRIAAADALGLGRCQRQEAGSRR